jgi:hypothetical protein
VYLREEKKQLREEKIILLRKEEQLRGENKLSGPLNEKTFPANFRDIQLDSTEFPMVY